MYLSRRCSVLIVVATSLLGSCSSESSSSPAPTSVPSVASSASSGSANDSTAAADGSVVGDGSAGSSDCAALGDALARILVNWQVVLGLANSPATEWATLPIGTLPEFGAQLATVSGALGSDSAAADAISFMSGANDIVIRGTGGDAAAQADLATYLGSDVTANIYKQQDISLAYANTTCGA